MTMIVRRLVEAGLAERRAVNGRSAEVELTAPGRAAVVRARREATAFLEEGIAALSDLEREQLATGLALLARVAATE